MVQDPNAKPIKQVIENLARPIEVIRGDIKGRGLARFDQIRTECICNRPYAHVMCINCGHLMFGRVRYGCPKHKMVTFLIDITNCPKCKGFEYMLEEIMTEDLRNAQENNNSLVAISNSDEEEDEDL